MAQAEESYYLTGLVQIGNFQRAFIYAHPADQTYTLAPGRETAGLRLLTLDTESGSVILQRGDHKLHLTIGGAKNQAPKTGISEFLNRGTLSPDFAGPWPVGYVPEMIRLHQTGMLPADFAQRQSPLQTTASPRYIRALRDYMSKLPEEQRAPFEAELERVTTPPKAAPLEIEGYENLTEGANPLTEIINQRNSGNALATSLADAQLIAKLFASPVPAIGSRLGTPVQEMKVLADLLRRQDDPAIRYRIRQELFSYASGGGEWASR